MTDHWEWIGGIVTAVVIAGMAILSKMLFVMGKDCKDYRANCSKTICSKMNDLKTKASDASAQAVVLDKEAKETLREINISILKLNKSVSELKGGFDIFLREFDKRK